MFHLSYAHARLLSRIALFLLFTLHISHCCSLNFICWIIFALGVSHTPTARQEEVSPVQCACVILGVHCISLLFAFWCLLAPGVSHALTAMQEEVSTCPVRMRAFGLFFALFLVFTLCVSHCCFLKFICWIILVLTYAVRQAILRTDTKAGGGFTCPMRMRAFCPVLLSSYHYGYLSLFTFQFLPSLF